MRSFKELQKVKVADMTGEELTMFNRVNATVKDSKEMGFFSKLTKFSKGTFNAIGDSASRLVENQTQQDKKTRITAIKEELSDLDQAYTASAIPEKKYNLIKAQLELELDELQ